MCSSTIHRTMLPLLAFLEAWYKSVHNTSSESVQSVITAKVSNSVTATINGDKLDFDALVAYFQKEAQEYTELDFTTKDSVVHQIDGQKAGVVGAFITYTGKKNGADVKGVANIIADIITENDGATSGADPRTIWKLDIVKLEN
ncbi:hypothetical protein BT69DRAFT_1321595 [Atractiella rhizophila]|nr:hypothetical protein BT69DRAFT_1321595 [Atractiella rhizophila]